MKKNILILIISIIGTISSYSQTISDKLIIHDTRDNNDKPNFNNHSIRADFKVRQLIGVPGTGNYSTNLTISPWHDSSGGLNHQMNFNDGGIFFRTGRHDSQSWNKWRRILVENENGNIDISDNQDVQIGKHLNDKFSYKELDMGHYALRWGWDSWDNGGPTLWQSAYGGIKFFTRGQLQMSINHLGNVGIGTENPKYKLDVAGTIRAQEVKIEINAGADFVFAEDYNLKPLSQVEAFVKDNKHLPEIPSDKQMQEDGLSVNEFQIKLLQKIEELTLYLIDQNKENEMLKTRVQELENKFNK